jgi:hypothetical protein
MTPAAPSRLPTRPRLFALPTGDRLPPAIVLFFDNAAREPGTNATRLGVELRDARSREPIAALGLRDAHAFLVGNGYRWEPAIDALWVRQGRGVRA